MLKQCAVLNGFLHDFFNAQIIRDSNLYNKELMNAETAFLKAGGNTEMPDCAKATEASEG